MDLDLQFTIYFQLNFVLVFLSTEFLPDSLHCILCSASFSPKVLNIAHFNLFLHSCFIYSFSHALPISY